MLHDVMDEAIGIADIVPAAICLGHRRRRSAGGLARRAPASCGASARKRARSSSTTRSSRSRPARRARRASSSSPAPGRSPTAGTRTNEAARAGGWGYVLGDEGSGYWIGRAALRAVLREADRRGPRTALTPLLLQHFGVAAAQSLIHEVYQNNLRPAAIGSLARCVQAAFSEGDEAAIGILRGAADELESSGVCGGAAPRPRRPSRFPSSWRAGSSARCRGCATSCRGACRWRRPSSTARLLDREPAAGAVSLALQEAQGGARIPEVSDQT